jgi:peptidoglycan hydrolase CwlO-like protein
MKKGIIQVLVILLVLVITVAVVGCSSDASQAKPYMKKGDAQLPDVEAKAAAWNAQVKAIGADPAKISAEVQQAKTVGDELIKATRAAKTEYEKIISLTEISGYREYAELRIGELDSIQQIVNKMYAFLDQRVAMVFSKDLSNYPALQQQVQTEIDPLSDKGQKFEQDAEKLKSEKKL